MTSSQDSIKIAGVTLSALIRDTSSSIHDCEGLLFGTVHTKEFQSFDDTQSNLLKQIQTTFAIQAYSITGELCSFYDGCGYVDQQRLTSFITARKQQLLGWFRFRRGVPLRPTLREMNVHRHLEHLFHLKTTNDHTVYAFDYRVFKHLPSGEFKPVPLHIMNLISSSQDEYFDFNPISSYTVPSSSPSSTISNTKTSDVFRELSSILYSTPNILDVPSPQVKTLEDYYLKTYSCLVNLMKEVKASEQEIRQLESEIEMLKQKRALHK